ncbi:MAG: tetratricopeptide repeat protein [Prevotella sp.]|nr:tetratricopeptide repeat protein [Prevotella sp.]
MNRLRYFISLLFIGVALVSPAQTQQGRVKTLGRPNKPGVALSGVTVRVRGAHNAVLSNAQGNFSIDMTGKKQGDAYSLQQVKKKGYELNDNGLIGRRYAFSSTVSLSIVMVSSSQLQADKQRMEDNAYKVGEKNYKEKIALLEKQRKTNQITIDQYRQQIQDLQNSFEKYQSLIDFLADHYARADYDELDEKEREINLCIENGDLNKAEQLLQQLDIVKRLADIEQRIKSGKSLMAEAEKDMARILRQQEKDAEYLYHLYTISLARFDNEKAHFYIETRAALDSTNIQWQIDAGEFASEYLSDYTTAKRYIEKATRQCLLHHGDKGYEMSKCYISLGNIYYYTAKYQEAKELYQIALNIRENLYGEFHESLVEPYCCIGNVVFAQTQYDKTSARTYFKKGLNICLASKGEDHQDIGACYYGLGLCDFTTGSLHKMTDEKQSQKEIADAVYDLKRAIELWQKQTREENSNIAHCYKAIGDIYLQKQDFQQAIAYNEKAVSIWKRIFGNIHIKLSDAYFSLGSIYSSIPDYDKGDYYYQQSLQMREQLLGPDHPKTVAVKKEIESLQAETKLKSKLSGEDTIEKAVEYLNNKEYKKALNTCKKIVNQLEKEDESSPEVADVYSFMGIITSMMGDRQGAIACYNHALLIWEKTNTAHHHDAAISYLMAGQLFLLDEQYAIALQYGTAALEIFSELEDVELLDIAKCHSLVGKASLMTGDLQKSKEHLEKAIKIQTEVNGGVDKDTKDLQTILDAVNQYIDKNRKQ